MKTLQIVLVLLHAFEAVDLLTENYTPQLHKHGFSLKMHNKYKEPYTLSTDKSLHSPHSLQKRGKDKRPYGYLRVYVKDIDNVSDYYWDSDDVNIEEYEAAMNEEPYYKTTTTFPPIQPKTEEEEEDLRKELDDKDFNKLEMAMYEESRNEDVITSTFHPRIDIRPTIKLIHFAPIAKTTTEPTMLRRPTLPSLKVFSTTETTTTTKKIAQSTTKDLRTSKPTFPITKLTFPSVTRILHITESSSTTKVTSTTKPTTSSIKSIRLFKTSTSSTTISTVPTTTSTLPTTTTTTSASTTTSSPTTITTTSPQITTKTEPSTESTRPSTKSTRATTSTTRATTKPTRATKRPISRHKPMTTRRPSLLKKPHIKTKAGKEDIENNCGVDNSDDFFVTPGRARIETYPWLGVLYYPAGITRITTTVVLITKQLVLAAAAQIHNIPKHNFRKSATVVLGRNCSSRGLGILEYNYHPEYRRATYSSLVILQLNSTDVAKYWNLLRPICGPPEHILEPTFYAKILSEDCRKSRIDIFEVDYVSPENCTEFYRRTGLDIATIWPTRVVCSQGKSGGDCIWDDGTVLAIKQMGKWHLMGFGIRGPGCQATSRFVDYTDFHHWVSKTVLRIGSPAITRLDKNEVVIRKTQHIQRFGRCDIEEIQYEMYTDSNIIETTIGGITNVAEYNLTLADMASYSCVSVSATYDFPYLTKIVKPSLRVHAFCLTPWPICQQAGSQVIFFNVQVYFKWKTMFRISVYGQYRKMVDQKTMVKYANDKRPLAIIPWTWETTTATEAPGSQTATTTTEKPSGRQHGVLGNQEEEDNYCIEDDDKKKRDTTEPSSSQEVVVKSGSACETTTEAFNREDETTGEPLNSVEGGVIEPPSTEKTTIEDYT